jgi:outer membrane protein TolC
MLVKNKYDEGRVLQTEMNRALLNHNNALLNYQSSTAALTNEIIYLSFLTGKALPELLEGAYDFSIFEKTDKFNNPVEIRIDSFPVYRQFSVRDELIKQQILSEKKKNLPTIGFQGFIGANQFTNGFNPFLNNSWFGNAYFGLTVKMPLLQSRNTTIVVAQFNNELKINDLNREDFKEKNTRDFLQTKENIKSGNEKIKLVSVNINLLKENITILMERLASGKQTASELNLAEIDLQKENTTLLQLKANLIKKQVELIYSMGLLNAFLSK